MLPLPNQRRNIIDLADWLELVALNSRDKNSSTGDLVSALTMHIDDRKEVEDIALDVIAEVEGRIRAAGPSYPFIIIDSRVIQAHENWENYVAYIFCLCLSYFGWEIQRDAPINPWFLFEELSSVAAKQYVDGEVYLFGRPRRGRSFAQAIDELTDRVGEGGGFRDQDLRSVKDDKVDLVAWKDFADKKSSKLVLFAQCASGANWRKKLGELDPDPFWNQWMREGQISQLKKSFFTPHKISHDEWDHRARFAGILFDRCRTSFWAFVDNDAIVNDNRYLDWCLSAEEGFRIA